MGWENLVAIALTVALGLMLVAAGIEDARIREIANWKNAAIALTAPLWWWANGLALWPDMAIQLGFAVVVFAILCGVFAMGWMGGGDVKLIAALSLWLPVARFLDMIMLMSIVGGGVTFGGADRPSPPQRSRRDRSALRHRDRDRDPHRASTNEFLTTLG